MFVLLNNKYIYKYAGQKLVNRENGHVVTLNVDHHRICCASASITRAEIIACLQFRPGPSCSKAGHG